MEEKPPMQKQSFAYILGWSQEKIAGQNRNLVNAVTLCTQHPTHQMSWLMCVLAFASC